MRGIFDVAGGIAGVLPIADVLQFSDNGRAVFLHGRGGGVHSDCDDDY